MPTGDCRELEAALDRAADILAEREKLLADEQRHADALTAELDELAASWSDGSHAGGWRDYAYALHDAWLAAGEALDAARAAQEAHEADQERRQDLEAQLEEAWEELERLLREHDEVQPQWAAVVAQLTGDAPTDMGSPQSALFAHAEALRAQLDALEAEIEAVQAAIASLSLALADAAPEEAGDPVADAERAYEAAADQREHWEDASRDLREELEAIHLDMREADVERAERALAEAVANYDQHCVPEAAPEQEEEDTGTP